MIAADRTRPLALFLICAAFTAGCASAQPQVDRGSLPLEIRRAVAEAHEELPGVVLTDRHLALAAAVRVTVATPDAGRTRAALDAAFAVADSVEKLVSVHVQDSEVAAINAAAGREPVRVSPWTEAMVVTALEWAERTGGAFDPTVGPLVTAWGFGTEAVAVPTEELLEAARRLVGWNKVQVDRQRHTVYLPEPGMELDLRALAKGFALDRMEEAMIAHGATSGIADFDGDIVFFGPGTETSDNLWWLEVPDPYDPSTPFARFFFPPGGFSTSSYYERAIEIDGQRYGHLIDPRTGRPAQAMASVGVYASEPVVNDILATALFIMGVEEGRRLAEELRNVEAVFVVDAPPGRRSEVVLTAGMGRYLQRLEPPIRPAVPEDD